MTTMEDLEQRLRAALSRRGARDADIAGARPAAVLIPIYPGPEPTLIFTVRTDALPTHKGQISFPGGKIDPSDESPREAALREAQEEIGLDPEAVTIVGELDATPTFVSGYVVTPVVGLIDERPPLDPNPAEVAEVLEVPVSDLVEDIRREAGFEEGGRSYPTEAWVWRGHVIWGLTARLLREFLTVLGDEGLATPPGETSSWTAWPMRSRAS